MGRWKSKPASPPRTSARDVRPRPPLNNALATLLEAVRVHMDHPGDGAALAVLAIVAALAWNLSRLEKLGPSPALDAMRDMWERVLASGPEVAPAAMLLLTFARVLEPGERRLMVHAHAAIRRGELVVEVDAYGAPEAAPVSGSGSVGERG